MIPLLLLPALSGLPSAPAEPGRELSFPGFNGHLLHGTVLPGGSHPCFAVMVAGAGLADRDWSSPVLRAPSHAGRDFAAWMQGQGIASLRFDKRTIGAQDPGLDASLDAQVGDLLAALQAARRLPEAKGRRILLVGHGEGALLALLAAREADAVLLLGMPGQSLRRQVLEQVRGQFRAAGAPPELRDANLGYLESVLGSIADGKPSPPPGSGVLPSIAALAKRLARPESLSFFRATLDLDPWLLASRVVVPLAAAWGGKDLQSWKPMVPPGFKGTVIDLPEANHLLKRERRPLAELDPAKAAAAYGDDTPLADLEPLAGWLKALPGPR